ncbi:MAG: chemotaxis protein CheX [bacterium]
MNEKLYQHIVESFTASTSNVFQAMIFTNIEARQPLLRSGLPDLADITGIISLTGDIMGSVILSIDNQTAQKAISNMLGDPIQNQQEIIDGIGEITNVIVGMAKTDLSNLSCDFEMSLPVMIIGGKTNIKHLSAEKKYLTTIPFETEDGSVFHLELFLRDDNP